MKRNNFGLLNNYHSLQNYHRKVKLPPFPYPVTRGPLIFQDKFFVEHALKIQIY